MDTVFIQSLRIDTVIGIHAFERNIRQAVVLDLELGFDNRVPAASDDIADTLDYQRISERLSEYVSGTDFGLVETLAERCAELLMREFGVRWLRLRVGKPGALKAADSVGVVIERGAAG
jgi:dihydroneopterin aldolase